MVTRLEQWWERTTRWYSNLPTWGKILSFLGFALVALLVSTVFVLLTVLSPQKRRQTAYANTAPDPMVTLLEGQGEVDDKIQKALDQAKKEIGDIEVKQERLEAAAREAHKAIEEAKSPNEIVKIIRRGVYTVIFCLLFPVTGYANVPVGNVFYPMPPGEEVEIDGELYQCFTFKEMQTIGHGYVEYTKLFQLRQDLNNLMARARSTIIISEIGAKSQRASHATLTAQLQFYKGSLDSVLLHHENESKKKDIEVWVWRIAAGLLVVTTTAAFVF